MTIIQTTTSWVVFPLAVLWHDGSTVPVVSVQCGTGKAGSGLRPVSTSDGAWRRPVQWAKTIVPHPVGHVLQRLERMFSD